MSKPTKPIKSNEIEQYRINKIDSLNKFYNTKLNQRRQLYNREYSALSKRLLPINQKKILLSSLLNKYNSDIKSLKLYIDKEINYIKTLTVNNINITNKRALIIGINYNGTNNQLNGCINDATNISNFIKEFDFKEENIHLMTDETEIKPTGSNIVNSITNFLKSGVEGELLFLYYSGHGSQTYDYSGDERDGVDELIVSADSFGITDDYLKQIIQNNLKKNVTLFCLFDCCNSGTMLNLKYEYLASNNYQLTQAESITDTNDAETTGNVVMLSGCRDEQYSYETVQTINSNKVQGIMTSNFINIIKNDPLVSWKVLLVRLRNVIKIKNFDQTPQLSSGLIIDMNSKVYL